MNLKMRIAAAAATIIIILTCLAATFQIEPANGEPLRVACVGDSITEKSSYPTQLKLLLGSNYSVGNFGVSGSTVSRDSNLPYMDQVQFQRVKDFQPDIVVVMLGTNDAAPNLQGYNDNFQKDYAELIGSLQSIESNPKIWVVKSPPIQNNSLALSSSFFSQEVVSDIEQTAKTLNLPTINVYDALGDCSEYFWDGVHPNAAGASVIASTVYNALTMPDGSPDYSFFEEQYPHFPTHHP
jgi:lysophospholipase L1-like esterase